MYDDDDDIFIKHSGLLGGGTQCGYEVLFAPRRRQHLAVVGSRGIVYLSYIHFGNSRDLGRVEQS